MVDAVALLIRSHLKGGGFGGGGGARSVFSVLSVC